jgi:hypothetical protein
LILKHLMEMFQTWMRIDCVAQDEEMSGYHKIFDSLVLMCDVPKMNDAIENFKAQRPTFYSPPLQCRDLNKSLLIQMRSETVLRILKGCDMLLKALTEMDLTECHKMTPLLTGDQIKQVLKNIPKGTMFGEVSRFPFFWGGFFTLFSSLRSNVIEGH